MDDKIILENCEFMATIGVEPYERENPRTICLDIALSRDIRPAAASDDINNTVCYIDVYNAVRDWIASREWHLIETVAEVIAKRILETFPVESVHLTVRKPYIGSSAKLDGCAIEITRTKQL